MGSRIYENIVEVEVPVGALTVKVRAWVNREEHGPTPDHDRELLAAALDTIRTRKMSVQDEYAAELVKELGPRLNAIEVRWGMVGMLIYPDWP